MSTNFMNKAALKKLTKSQLVELLLKKNSEIENMTSKLEKMNSEIENIKMKSKIENIKNENVEQQPKPINVKQMVQDYEEKTFFHL